jgi:ech hydrogenase subunit D
MDESKYMIQDITTVDPSNLLESVADIQSDGYRLGQACATKAEGSVEILYTFEKDETIKNLKVILEDKDPEIHSITGTYWPAFIYENEMHDLFGVKFRNLALDFGGHFFKIASETPWNPVDKRGAGPEDAPVAKAEKLPDAEPGKAPAEGGANHG